MRWINRAQLTLVVAGFVLGGSVSAQSAPPAEPSADVRQKMATLHEQMATCLRSDKSLATCRAEMMKNCREQLGDDCRMMGHAAAGTHRMHPMGAAPDK